jgi:hypothetical protein
MRLFKVNPRKLKIYKFVKILIHNFPTNFQFFYEFKVFNSHDFCAFVRRTFGHCRLFHLQWEHNQIQTLSRWPWLWGDGDELLAFGRKKVNITLYYKEGPARDVNLHAGKWVEFHMKFLMFAKYFYIFSYLLFFLFYLLFFCGF